MSNRLVERIGAKGHVVGVLAQIDNLLSLEVAASSGFDFVLLDLQHGLWNVDGVVSALRALDSTDCIAVPRLSGHLPQEILWLLDSGYESIVAPMVDTRAEAEALVDACYYPPKGKRSRGRARAGIRGGEEYFRRIDEDLLFLPMFETVESLDEVEDILSMDGVGGCFIGPGDLRFNLEATESSPHGIDEAIQYILDATLSRGKIAAFPETDVAGAVGRINQGFHMVTIASDVRVLESGWMEMHGAFQRGLRGK